MRRLSVSSALLLLYLTFPAFSSPLDHHIRVAPAERPANATCGGDLDAPIDIEIDAFSALKRPGGFVNVFGTVTPEHDIDGLRLRFEAEGSASIFNNSPQFIGRAPAGVPIDFSLLARFGAGSEGAIHVWAESDLQQDAYRWSKRETLYAIVHGGRLYTGMGDWQRLKRIAIQDDIAAGLSTAEEAKAQAASLRRVPFVRDPRPFVARELSAEEERLNAIVGASPRPRRDRIATDSHHGSNILVRGTVRWTDENGNTHPLFGASVDIRDSDTGFDETIMTVGTGVDGTYEAVVNNDDGIGAGNRDIYVRVRLENSLIDTMSAGLFGGTYEMESSPVHDETPDGTIITENFTTANTGTGPAASVFQSATWIAVYARDRHGLSASVDVIWPNGDDGSFYDGDVQIEQADRWDWDTIHHEYGHFVMDELDIEDNPGGPHNIGECAADVREEKSEGNRLAWGEGWPTYFGTSGQQQFNMGSFSVPRVGDAAYDDLEDGSVSYSMETNDNQGMGEDNELAVQRLLWDLFDGNSDSRDAVSRSDQTIWTAINGADPHILSSAWAALRAGQSNANQILMGEIAADHLIGPTLNSPAEGATVSSGGSAVFSWDRNVGCSTTYDGNSFDLVFFHPSTFAPVLTIPNILTGTTYALSAAEIGTIISAAGHQVLWGVEARNTSSPATGPYLGETFQITVNRPPVADAGPDQTVECTTAGTTPVSLNGTASSDPDGDTLTYSWSMNSVVFSTSATPTGNFPIGTTVVTLRVSDGMASDTDTVSITVRDTTPPVISCPANVTVECTGDLGVQADDPQLAPFFAGVSATDLCDNSPTITNDAPAFFPLGETIVTFTATDDHGNVSTCAAKVKVVDTKAPAITATLSAVTLWPANHKLVTINAAIVVTDECDPNPTFVLTSIVSNEPDNGLGDGDTANDIQGAAYGMPDTEFQLRAERAGPAPGRVYTITYTGSDSSGNTAQTQVQVKVPHSMK